jgi:TRAP-type C4-dicarboxylate transport system substrate-binding protein
MKMSSSAIALVLAASAVAANAQTVTIRVHHATPGSSIYQTELVQPWCDKIAAQSSNRMKCEIYPSMQLGGTAAQLFDQVRDGTVDATWTNPGFKPGSFTKTEVFELPFMVKNAEGGSRALWDFIQAHAMDEYRGVKVLWVAITDPQLLHFSSKNVRTIEEAANLKVRAPSRYAAKGLAALGMATVQLPSMAITESLSKGVIDGTMMTWSGVPMLKLDEVTKFHLDVPEGQTGFFASATVFAMNPAKYDSLPADLKKVIDANSGRDQSAVGGKFFADKISAYSPLGNAGGGRNVRLSKEEYARWVKATESVEIDWVKEVSAKGADGKKMLDDAKALVNKYPR